MRPPQLSHRMNYRLRRIKPDITGYDRDGKPSCLQEIVVTHEPEEKTLTLARTRDIPLVIVKVIDTQDLERIKTAEPLRVQVCNVRCSCESQACEHWGLLWCRPGGYKLPHRRCPVKGHYVPRGLTECCCPVCGECPHDAREHRHCGCGERIYGQYRQCYCCNIGCQDRTTDHRHCKQCRKGILTNPLQYDNCYCCNIGCAEDDRAHHHCRGCRTVIRAKNRDGYFFKQCLRCYKEPPKHEPENRGPERVVMTEPQHMNPSVPVSEEQKEAWRELNNWFKERQGSTQEVPDPPENLAEYWTD